MDIIITGFYREDIKMNVSKRIFALALAGIMAAASAVSVFAEASDKYVSDASMITEDHDAPTLSFDMSDWKDYIKPLDSGDVTFDLSSDNKTSYQGQSLKIKATSAGKIDDKDMAYNWEIWDSDNVPIFESEADPEKDYYSMGVMLSAKDLGLECFNGATVTFKYRIGEDAKGLIMGDTILAAPVDAEGKRLDGYKVFKLAINEVEANNVSKYANGIVSIADMNDDNNVPAENLLLMIPVHSKTEDTAVLYLDNLTIKLQSGAQVMNLDGYNKNAQPKDDNEIAVEIQQERNDVKISSDDVPMKSKVKSVILVVLLVIVGVAAVSGVVFLFIKLKKRFY